MKRANKNIFLNFIKDNFEQEGVKIIKTRRRKTLNNDILLNRENIEIKKEYLLFK